MILHRTEFSLDFLGIKSLWRAILLPFLGFCALSPAPARGQDQPPESTSSEEMTYAVRLTGDDILSKVKGSTLGLIKIPRFTISKSTSGSVLTVSVGMDVAKEGQNPKKGEGVEGGTQTIKFSRMSASHLFTLKSVERSSSSGRETFAIETTKDKGFGPSSVLRKHEGSSSGRTVSDLSGEFDPAIPVVPFEALAVWLLPSTTPKEDAIKAPSVYVLLGNKLVNFDLKQESNKDSMIWRLMSTDSADKGIEIKLSYHVGTKNSEDSWPNEISMQNDGRGVTFYAEDHK